MWKIIENRDWDYLRTSFDWIRDMEGVVQDSIHHAEGDVATHTQMVVKELLESSDHQALSDQDQEVLFAAALLHDVEKRSTTVIEDDGSVTSRGHALKGEYTARTILFKNHNTPFAIKEKIAKLVRYHGLPLWIFEKKDPLKTLLKTSLEVNLAHLALLSKADVLGRICKDQEELLYRIELFEEFCKEQNCLNQSRHFDTDLAKFNYFYKENNSPDFVPFEKDVFEVILFCALPGTGKDTFIAQHYSDLPVVSLDNIRRKNNIKPTDKKKNGWVIQMAKEQAKVHLRKRECFVWNATNIYRNLRGQIISLFHSYGAKVKVIYLEVPYKRLMNQNQNREYPVPNKVLEKMISKLDVPAPWEAPIVEYKVK